MADFINVAVDAMGGDNAPVEIVKGVVDAVHANDHVKVYLTGQEELVRKELEKYTYPADRIEVVNATEVIETAEPPVMAIRRKKDSSIVRALNLVKDGTCDAFVSAGSTGATLVGGQVIVGRIKGVERPPLAPLIPTEKGCALLIDCGANVDARPSHLVQFAKMGSVYMESVMGISNPRVGIVNIGAEEEKGNALVKETYPLLKNCPDIHFIGRVFKYFTEPENITEENDESLKKVYHQTVKKVTSDFETLGFNTAIAQMMIFMNAVTKGKCPREYAEGFIKMFSCICPHTGEELWEILGHTGTIAFEKWPEYDEAAVKEDTVEIGIQINGKVKATVMLPADVDKDTAIAKGKEVVADKLTGTIVKEIYVPGRIINIVVK